MGERVVVEVTWYAVLLLVGLKTRRGGGVVSRSQTKAESECCPPYSGERH